MKFECITTTREDMIAISHILAQVIHPEHLQKKEKPLIIKANGSINSGKSIFTSLIRNDILGADAKMSGDKGCHEYWTKKIHGKTMEISSLDNGHWHISDQELHDRTPKREENFLKRRSEGGISFIQNSFDPERADLSVWVEAPAIFYTEEYNTEPVFGDRRLPQTLAAVFKEAHDRTKVDDRSWVRYIQLSVYNTNAFDTDLLKKSLSGLKLKFQRMTEPKTEKNKTVSSKTKSRSPQLI